MPTDEEKKETEKVEEEEAKEPRPEELKAELARREAKIKELNKESAARRIKLQEYEAAEEKRKQAELSATEKAQADLAKAQKELADTKLELSTERIKSSVLRTASDLNFADGEDAYTLIDISELEMDDGKVKGVKEALEKLAKAKPYLLKQVGGGGTPKGNQQPLKEFSADDLIEKKRHEYHPL